MTDSQYAKTLEQIRRISRNQGIDLTLDKNDIDVIIGPADSAFSMLATSAGTIMYPSLLFVKKFAYQFVRLPNRNTTAFILELQRKAVWLVCSGQGSSRRSFAQSYVMLGEFISKEEASSAAGC